MTAIIPEATQGAQAWDRYTFVNNNPVGFYDPSGHSVACGTDNGNGCGGGTDDITDILESRRRDQLLNNKTQEYSGPKLPATGDTSDKSDCSCNTNDILGGVTLIAFGSIVTVLGVGLVAVSVAELTATSPTIVGIVVGFHGLGVGVFMTYAGAFIVGKGIKIIFNSGCLPLNPNESDTKVR